MFALLFHEPINILCCFFFSPPLIKDVGSETLRSELEEGEKSLHNEESLIKI